jgi:hypothetical protein
MLYFFRLVINLGFAVGDEYPSAEVIGTDLSPIQPGWFASFLS